MENKKQTIALPHKNADGYYDIRMESIGGLGANLCSKLLGESGAVYLGFNSASFSSYGSEKRGSAVKSYIRWSDPDKEILLNSPVEEPSMLVLFHIALSKTMPVTAGVKENCTVVINTDCSPDEIRDKLKLYAGKICCVNALELAMKSKSRINMIMLGAIAKASGFIPIDAVKNIVSDTLGKKYPDVLKANLNGIAQGYESVEIKVFKPDGKYKYIPYENSKNKWGYDNAPIGGENFHIGSTVSNDLSPSREGYIPLFIYEKCIHCGLCDSTCPDMVFQFVPGKYKDKNMMLNHGLDYHHCKGCLRCVDVCPVEALVAGKESEHPHLKWFVRNKDLICDNLNFDPAGADPYITSESYLNENRVDGGIL